MGFTNSVGIEHEKLPTELGWSKKTEMVGLKDILRVTQMISNATSLLTGASTTAKRRDFHGGMHS